jgi:hypothetical protein
MNRSCLIAGFALLVGGLVGCTTVEQSPSVTETDKELASPEYWLKQPATSSVTHDNYDELWEACKGVARWRGFLVDRQNYREGVLTTLPLVSKQLFEPWRRDVATIADMTESTLATERRIVRFEIAKNPDDDTFTCVPKVLVQRYTSTERRITSITRYRESFSIETAQGNKETDKGVDLPVEYWYTTGRDAQLEKRLADGVQSRVRGMVASR